MISKPSGISPIIERDFDALDILRCSHGDQAVGHPTADRLVNRVFDTAQDPPNITADLFAELEIMSRFDPAFQDHLAGGAFHHLDKNGIWIFLLTHGFLSFL